MKLYSKIALLALTSAGLALSACKDDKDEAKPVTPPVVTTIEATQADLDKAIQLWQKDITGGMMAHNGNMTATGHETYRDVFGTNGKTGEIKPGVIVTKNVYARDTTSGARGALQVSFAMIKREAGYLTNGGDWEYLMIPFDAGTDYKVNPNGKLPATAMRMSKEMQVEMCGSCHKSAPGSDFLYMN